ncbi:PAS domain S-box protein [bacterium]|nr:PAS domain S-box protein [bacterium]
MGNRRPSEPSPDALHDLQLTDARWRAVFSAARDAIISIDAAGIITLFNPGAAQVFGYREDEVLGRNVAMLMPEPYAADHDAFIRRYQRTGVAHAIGRVRHVQARRKNGEVFPIELTVSEARLGDEVLYTAILRDISEQRELQRVVRERERLADIGAITAKIVHDLGNPLAALSMQAQLLLRRAKRGDFAPVSKVRDPAEQILQTLGRLETLVREFMEFAREQRPSLRPIAVERLLRSCVDMWQPLAQERDITIRLDGRQALPELRGDEIMLRRVLDNLVKNAIEAIQQGPGSIVVRAELPTAAKISLVVEDDGPGVREGLDVFRLFETTKSEGTGIGLAVAKQLVGAHGGSIAHQPRKPRGTVFRIELPLGGPTSRE